MRALTVRAISVDRKAPDWHRPQPEDRRNRASDLARLRSAVLPAVRCADACRPSHPRGRPALARLVRHFTTNAMTAASAETADPIPPSVTAPSFALDHSFRLSSRHFFG